MSNLETINSSIAEMEKILSIQLTDYFIKNELNLSKFYSNLEWFITWRIKLEDLQNTLWCDGVWNLQISTTDKLSIKLEGKTYIGPESNVSKIYQCPLVAEITLDKSSKTIEKYHFHIDFNGREIVMTNHNQIP